MARKAVYPPKQIHSLASSHSPPKPTICLTALICFPLCLIRTRWIRLSLVASRLRNHLSPPFLPLASLVYDTPQILSLCGFWQGEGIPSQSLHFIRQRIERKHEEAALGTQTGLSLPARAGFPLFSISCLFARLLYSLGQCWCNVY